MYGHINQLVTGERFELHVWGDIGTLDLWAGLGCQDFEIDFFRNIHLPVPQNTYADDFVDAAIEAVLATDWLPYVVGCSMNEALAKLESRLAGLPEDEIIRESDWSDLVVCAIHDLRRMNAASLKGESQPHPTVLKRPYNEALMVMNIRYGAWPREKTLFADVEAWRRGEPADKRA